MSFVTLLVLVLICPGFAQYVGEGEKLVKAVFSLARRLSPCVVFLDEIDALFGARSSARDSGGAMAHRGVITEFMQEMDGLKSQAGMEERVVVIGATNRPFDLDDAVLRRLPRRLLVDLPGEKEREGEWCLGLCCSWKASTLSRSRNSPYFVTGRDVGIGRRCKDIG